MSLLVGIGTVYALVAKVLVIVLAMCAFAGAGIAAYTRSDAFEVADRQNKWVWAGLLVVSAIAVFYMLPFLSWIGLVIIGLFWFDVRPQIKDILSGNYGW